ncbi:CD1845 family protein [Intestinimonas massiliensis (ex Afouda et al. 2020)]|uniref:CD1845 family protein n=1 Tax=Intestinimonas massiliensis (ex Afouda et al. 2020) TaxID=1673721 RepID=UPI00067F06C4|nr:CD1845 family protein [Intestinimonas massiliensis (ex Afouda et al. 2020)]
MIVLKILAAPVMVIAMILAALINFLFCVAYAFCYVICVILVILSVLLFITGETTGGIVFIILAFLFSPFGIPAIAEWLVLKLNDLKENLKDFITS